MPVGLNCSQREVMSQMKLFSALYAYLLLPSENASQTMLTGNDKSDLETSTLSLPNSFTSSEQSHSETAILSLTESVHVDENQLRQQPSSSTALSGINY